MAEKKEDAVYKVVFEFHTDLSLAKKRLAVIKKKIPEAEIEETKTKYLIVLGNFDSKSMANQMIHTAVKNGYWGGIYKSNPTLFK